MPPLKGAGLLLLEEQEELGDRLVAARLFVAHGPEDERRRADSLLVRRVEHLGDGEAAEALVVGHDAGDA